MDINIHYKAGMIATFIGAHRQVAVCTPSSVPIGFFLTSGECLSTSQYLMDTNVVSVAVGQGEYRTDTFENETYKIRDLLYCSPKGLITNKKTLENQATVGTVNYVSVGPSKEIGFVSYFTNLAYCKFR